MGCLNLFTVQVCPRPPLLALFKRTTTFLRSNLPLLPPHNNNTFIIETTISPCLTTPLVDNHISKMITKFISLFILLSAAMGLTPYQLPRDAPAFQRRNFDTINKIYNLTTYPNNLIFLQGGVEAIPDGLFSQDVVGRITPVGNFSGSKYTPNTKSPCLYGLEV